MTRDQEIRSILDRIEATLTDMRFICESTDEQFSAWLQNLDAADEDKTEFESTLPMGDA